MRGINYLDFHVANTLIDVSIFLEKITKDHLPKDFDTVEEYAVFVKSILGYEQLSIEEVLSETEIVEELVHKFFLSTGATASEIEFIIISSEKSITNLGQHLIKKFKLSRAKTIQISGNNCANIDVAIDMVCRNTYFGNALVITHTRQNHIKDRIFESYAIKGDGAGLIYINNRGKLILKDTQIINSLEIPDNSLAGSSLVHYKYYNDSLGKLSKANIIFPENIDYIVLQNANTLLYKQSIKFNGFDDSKIMSKNHSKYGHLDGLDILINLKTIIDENDDTSLIIVLNFGWSGVYTASLYKKNITDAIS